MPLTRFLSISEASSIVSPSTGYRGFDVQQSEVGPTDRMGFPSHLLYQPSSELSEQLASVSLLGPWPWLQHQRHGRPSRINPPLLLQPLDPATPLKRTANHTEPHQSRPPTWNTGVSLHTGLAPLSRASLTSQRVGFQCSPTSYEGYQDQMSFTLSVNASATWTEGDGSWRETRPHLCPNCST